MDKTELNQKHETIAAQIIQLLRDNECSIRDVKSIIWFVESMIRDQKIA